MGGGCADAPVPPLPQDPTAMPVEESEHVYARYYRSTFLSARLFAPRYRRFAPGAVADEAFMEFPDGLLIQFYDSATGRLEAVVRARYARRYLSRRLSELRQEVVLVNPNGDSLLTEALFWDETKDRIYSDLPVQVITPRETIFAEGFESDVRMSDIQFYKIRGRIRTSPDSL